MELLWLLPVLLSCGGVASVLDTETVVNAVAIKVFASDTRQTQSQVSSPICVYHVSLSSLHSYMLPNQTQRAREAPLIEASIRGPSGKSTHHPLTEARLESSEVQQPEPSPNGASMPDSDPTNALPKKETRNPAPANRAVAGMGAALVGVMLIFTLFL